MESNLGQESSMFCGDIPEGGVRVKILGVGSAGGNVLNGLQLENHKGIELAYLNTDVRGLSESLVTEKIAVGRSLTRGLGAGGESDIGRKSAELDRDVIAKAVEGLDMVFIVSGLGGGTGSGAAPVVADIASEAGALVIAFVALPFTMEGTRRLKVADEAMIALRKKCDAVIPLPNDVLLQQCQEDTSVLDAFSQGDEWMNRGIQSICSMIFKNGLIDVDFATLKKVFSTRGGRTLFGLGTGQGEDAAQEALKNLFLCPLLHTPEHSKRADRLLVNIVGGTDLSMPKVQEIMKQVTEKFCSSEDTVFGAIIDESKKNSVEISVIGTTDVEGKAKPAPEPVKPEKEAPVVPIKEDQPPAVHQSKLKNKTRDLSSQGELELFSDNDQRGYFSKTEKNLYEGEDLDVPTYLRRGIHIAI